MASASRTIQLNIIGDPSSANKALDQVADQGEKSQGRISGAFKNLFGIASSSGALGPLQGVIDQATQMLDKLGEHGASVGQKLMGAGAGVAGIGMMGQQFGSADKEAQQQLAAAIKNTGGSFDDYKDQVDQAVSSHEKYGRTASQTMNALQTLTQATGDPAAAMKYLKNAEDLAAAGHTDLGTAATKYAAILEGKGSKTLMMYGLAQTKSGDLAKAQAKSSKDLESAQTSLGKAQENLTMLEDRQHAKKKLTISDQQALQKAHEAVTTAQGKLSTAQAHATTIQDQAAKGVDKYAAANALAAKVSGQADAASNSLAGKMRALKAEVEDGAAKLGQKYGPAVTALGAGMSVAGAGMETVSGIMGRLKGAQEGVTAATEAGTTATEAASVAEDEAAVSEGIALGPILLIIAAIALLGFGLYELVTHWSTVWGAIKTAAVDAWHFIDSNLIQPLESGLGAVIDWISSHWALLLEILTGPIGLAAGFISQHFDDIKGFAFGAVAAVGGIFDWLVRIVTGLPGRIADAASGMWDGITGAFKSAINWIIGKWNGLSFTVGGGSFLGVGIPSATLSVPSIPYLAAGGIVRSPTLAMIGEAGPEAVIPLSGGAGGFGGGDLTVEVPLVLDGRVLARSTARYTRDEMIRSGRRNPTVSSGLGVNA